jgi:hypothetical protein
MRKEKQIGIRVGLPAFFTLELEDIYKHASGAHRALAFPDFCGFLIGLGLEAYKKTNRQENAPEIPAAPDDGEPWGEELEPDNPFRRFPLAREEA